MSDLKKTIKFMEVDNEGRTTKVFGACKAKDLQKDKLQPYWDEDHCLELGIRRID